MNIAHGHKQLLNYDEDKMDIIRVNGIIVMY